LLGVAGDPPFGSAIGDIHHRTFPGHPHGEGGYLIQGDIRMVANTPFGRATGGVVVYTIARKDLNAAVIHPHRAGNYITSSRNAKPLVNSWIQVDSFGNHVKLTDSNIQGIMCATHGYSPF
jgi:hypothetical protein